MGAIVTLYRDGRTTVLSAGRADASRPGAPRAGDHMRLASVSKAFTGAVALHLVQEGRLGLGDTIGRRLPGMPPAWARVTVREMLNHTSGLPDYTQSPGFRRQATTDPHGYVSPRQIIGWVRGDRLDFTPGSRYAYSNTDNIVVALIAEPVTGQSFARLLSTLVFHPARLAQTTFPSRRISLPKPFLHGYDVAPGRPPQDVTTFLSPSGAWASGAIVSTRPTWVRSSAPISEGGSSDRRSGGSRCASSRAPPARRGRAPTRPAWRCSGTGRAAAPSTATPATSRGMSNGRPRPPTAGAR